MKFLRNIFISVLFIFSLLVGNFAYAAENFPVDTVQTTINKYILQVYKFQGDKILQDLDANLEKVAPTKVAKLESYTSIQKTLRLKKENIDDDTTVGKTAKNLLTKYLDYMITEIETKKKKL